MRYSERKHMSNYEFVIKIDIQKTGSSILDSVNKGRMCGIIEYGVVWQKNSQCTSYKNHVFALAWLS